MAAEPGPAAVEHDGAALDLLAARALALTGDARVFGLGTGRAASAFIRALGAQVKTGRAVHGVPTSEASEHLANEMGIPLTSLGDHPVDVTVDGADEVDPRLDLIKGYGGALVRERIVASAANRRVIVVEAEKLVPVLGSRGRLPIEIVPFALPLVFRRLRALGHEAIVRMRDGRPYVSDNGNLIIDCVVTPIREPRALADRLRDIPGVVDTGLFLDVADVVLVAEDGVVRELQRARREQADDSGR